MKTVTIPEGMNPFVVYSNGVKYVYSPGETVEVPDGVAIEIEEYRDAQNKKPGAVDAPFDSDCCDSGAGDGGTVHIGAEAPTDNAALWVDTDEEGAIPWEAISDKPFYESVSEFLPETEFTFSEGQYFSDEYAGADFVVGKTYKVIWNGVEYSCVAFMGEGIMIGNVSSLIGTGDTGEPFVIRTYSPNSIFSILSLAGETSATVKILGVTVKKLDEKFLPRNIVYGDLVNGWLYKDTGLTTYCTRDEIIALGTNFEVSIVDTETMLETGQLCKPLFVKDEGVDSCAIIYMYYLNKDVGAHTIFMRTDGYTASPV